MLCKCGREIPEGVFMCDECAEPKDAWVATIHIMVTGWSEAEAKDAISELLSEATEVPDESCVVDWGYVEVYNKLLSPEPFGQVILGSYQEGAFLTEMRGG